MIDADAIRTAGLHAHAAGNAEEARRLYRLATVMAPQDHMSVHYWGVLTANAGDMATAGALLKRSVRLKPDDAAYLHNCGMLLRTAGQDKAALPYFLTATILQPDLALAHYQSGLLFQDMGAYAAANWRLAEIRRPADTDKQSDELITFNRVFHTGEAADQAPRHWAAGPLASIVIPCYNYGRFVGEAVESCLRQTYPHLEVILVEGGSTDNETRPKVEEISRLNNDKLRTVYRWPRRKVGDNRNFGLGLARGAYVCCLDADDILHPEYIEKAVFVLERLQYDVVGARVRIFGVDPGERGFLQRPMLNDFLTANQLATPAVHRRALWEESGGFYDFDGAEGYVYEDWNYWTRLAAAGAKVFNINWEALIFYRDHECERITKKNNILPYKEQIEAIKRQNSDLIK